ncbi:MAG TPA: DUF502 domain-containing protein [Fibrobacteria bacterium]|nr:DUF502 domain-containing protein [Fibrobacteria bacterium]
MQRVFTNFLKGILILGPLFVTFYVIWIVFVKIDGLLNIPIPGVGFALTILFIILVGFLASNILFERIFSHLEKGMTRLPVVKLLYFSIKDFINAFVGEKKSFTRPVMLSLSSGGGGADLKVLGFVTADTLDLPGVEDRVAVYLPQSYNFGGLLVLVPRDQVTPLATGDSAKIMAFIVSGGVSRGAA